MCSYSYLSNKSRKVDVEACIEVSLSSGTPRLSKLKTSLSFRVILQFSTVTLAHLVDSLVRVSDWSGFFRRPSDYTLSICRRKNDFFFPCTFTHQHLASELHPYRNKSFLVRTWLRIAHCQNRLINLHRFYYAQGTLPKGNHIASFRSTGK